jgi:hypothetical protein
MYGTGCIEPYQLFMITLHLTSCKLLFELGPTIITPGGTQSLYSSMYIYISSHSIWPRNQLYRWASSTSWLRIIVCEHHVWRGMGVRVSKVTKPCINADHLAFWWKEGVWWGERQRQREHHALGLPWDIGSPNITSRNCNPIFSHIKWWHWWLLVGNAWVSIHGNLQKKNS